MKFIIPIFLISFLISCSSDCGVIIGVPFAIEEGESYCLPENRELQILEITHSYCPCDVTCIWEGEALVTANLVSADGQTKTIMIHESIKDNNVDNLDISSVVATSECTPSITRINIVINR